MCAGGRKSGGWTQNGGEARRWTGDRGDGLLGARRNWALHGLSPDWGKLLSDTAAVTALLDRLLHHAHVLKCGPKSWRTKVQVDLR